MIKVDYLNNNTINLIASIQEYYGIKHNYPTLPYVDELLKKNYKHIVVCLFDGMGSYILDKHLNKDDFFIKNKVMDISTVFPPTTVAATTTVINGNAPIEHGWLGWHLYLNDTYPSIELFKNLDYYKEEEFTKLKVREVLDNSRWCDKLPNNVKYHQIFPSFDKDGYELFDDALNKLNEVVNINEQNYTYFYWTDPDATMHVEGTTSNNVNSLIKKFNDSFEQFYLKQNEDTIIFIIADHGMMDIENVYLDDHIELTNLLVKPMSGEGRDAQLYVKVDKVDEFIKLFNDIYKDDFILLNNEEYIKSGISGLFSPHESTKYSLGNLHAIAVSNKILGYRSANKTVFLGHHAGFTNKEMIIPLIVLKKIYK